MAWTAGSRAPDLTERVTATVRPDGLPILRQTWEDALFLHWRVPMEWLKHRVPAPLRIDTFQGSAWVGIVMFAVRDSHPAFTPRFAWIRDFHEVNVRTYVHLDGVPGVWFFSLDADSPVAVTTARTFFRLPYFESGMLHNVEGQRIHMRSSRISSGVPASITATWTPGPEELVAPPGSLEFFWVERYNLFTADSNTLYRTRVHHEPWPLREVPIANYDTTLLHANGFPLTETRDRAHLLAGGPVESEIWPLEALGTF
jgi:uncharacterized protein YqjF (DUF2071 family)